MRLPLVCHLVVPVDTMRALFSVLVLTSALTLGPPVHAQDSENSPDSVAQLYVQELQHACMTQPCVRSSNLRPIAVDATRIQPSGDSSPTGSQIVTATSAGSAALKIAAPSVPIALGPEVPALMDGAGSLMGTAADSLSVVNAWRHGYRSGGIHGAVSGAAKQTVACAAGAAAAAAVTELCGPVLGIPAGKVVEEGTKYVLDNPPSGLPDSLYACAKGGDCSYGSRSDSDGSSTNVNLTSSLKAAGLAGTAGPPSDSIDLTSSLRSAGLATTEHQSSQAADLAADLNSWDQQQAELKREQEEAAQEAAEERQEQEQERARVDEELAEDNNSSNSDPDDSDTRSLQQQIRDRVSAIEAARMAPYIAAQQAYAEQQQAAYAAAMEQQWQAVQAAGTPTALSVPYTSSSDNSGSAPPVSVDDACNAPLVNAAQEQDGKQVAKDFAEGNFKKESEDGKKYNDDASHCH